MNPSLSNKYVNFLISNVNFLISSLIIVSSLASIILTYKILDKRFKDSLIEYHFKKQVSLGIYYSFLDSNINDLINEDEYNSCNKRTVFSKEDDKMNWINYLITHSFKDTNEEDYKYKLTDDMKTIFGKLSKSESQKFIMHNDQE